MFTVISSWVSAPLISLWQFMGGKIMPLGSCSNSYTCGQLVSGATTGGMVISGLIIGPIILYGLWAVFSWVWNPESSG